MGEIIFQHSGLVGQDWTDCMQSGLDHIQHIQALVLHGVIKWKVLGGTDFQLTVIAMI